MGILNRISMAKENFRKNKEIKAQSAHLQNKLDLEAVKAEKQKLMGHNKVANELKQEKIALRKEQHPTAVALMGKVKTGLATMKKKKEERKKAELKEPKGKKMLKNAVVKENPFSFGSNANKNPFGLSSSGENKNPFVFQK